MSRDSIKMVAMLTMLINHIANVFLPAGQPLTNLCLCIGYFTAVTMCFFLVEGYGCTRSKRRYAGRLLGFAVLAQLPNGATVTILGQFDEWYTVEYDGLHGFASSRYITVL